MKTLKIVHGYRPYAIPKKGLFRVPKKDGVYILPDGWETVIEESTIIGETSTSYVYKLKPTEEGKWVGNKVVTTQFILPLGIHKSRLVEWCTPQLKLFQNPTDQ